MKFPTSWRRVVPSVAPALVVVGLLTGCGLLARRSWPDVGGEAQVPGLSGPVTTYVDALGVPHIFAASEADGARMIGYLHGSYRRFQMEMIRMAAQGRLTEVLGADLLPVDRRLRLLTYKLDEATANLPPQDRARAQAYCDGVNQAWAEAPRPLEFKLLGYEAPPWTPRDVLAIGRLQSWDLSYDAENEAARDRLAAAVSPEIFSFLTSPSLHLGTPIVKAEEVKDQRPPLPPSPSVPAPQTLVDAAGREIGEAQPRDERTSPSPLGELDPDEVRREVAAATVRWLDGGVLGGSNAWALAPSRTTNGKALLATDPHLDLPWPSIFYEVHLHTSEIDVSGATFPGLPMVVIGRTSHMAWGLTTSYADAQDLFRIKVDPRNPDAYLLDGASVPFETWPQTFKVGEGEEITETYLATRFGPVYNKGREDRLLPGTTYALSWPGFDPVALELTGSFDRLYRARTPQEVFDAVDRLRMPSQSWTFATAGGQIGWVMGGDLPDRPDSPVPRDGSTSASAWSGWLRSEDRPRLVDPPLGYIVASNQAVSPELKFNRSYASGTYRALRIATALESRPTWDVDSSRGLQVDIANLEAARIGPALVEALKVAPLPADLPADRRARLEGMVAALSRWDFQMDKSSPAPLIYESWRGHLHQRLFGLYIADKALLETYLRLRFSEAPMEAALFTEEGRRWWTRPGAAPSPTDREQTILAALLDAEVELSSAFGSAIDKWSWGDAHVLVREHPFAAKKVLRPIFGVDAEPASGGRHTVFALAHFGVLGDYKVDSGPALRQVVQPGESAGFVIPGGNAGLPRHRWAHNQMESWWRGQQHRAGGEEKVLSEQAVAVIEWVPASK